jgi:hypothetical protein
MIGSGDGRRIGLPPKHERLIAHRAREGCPGSDFVTPGRGIPCIERKILFHDGRKWRQLNRHDAQAGEAFTSPVDFDTLARFWRVATLTQT